MNAPRPWVVIGNPENRRIELFQAALARCGEPPATVFSYRDLLSGRQHIQQLPACALVRIESPGENFEVERQLLALGEQENAAEGGQVVDPRDLTFDHGRIWPMRQWYLGYRRLLTNWQQAFAERDDLLLTNSPADILTLFDKRRTHACLSKAGVPVPPALPPVASFEELLTAMRERGWARVFLKPAHGSSASGVVALHVQQDRMLAVTSVEMQHTADEVRLYNSLRLQRYAGHEEVAALFQALLPQRLHIEQWRPKASQAGRVFDLRVVVIAGEPANTVVRTSRSPLTNLHLGNRRGDLAALEAAAPPAKWMAGRAACMAAAQCFPASSQLGVDLLFTPGFHRHAVLEVNAFGDLLPGVLWEGRDTYESQVQAILAKAQLLSESHGG